MMKRLFILLACFLILNKANGQLQDYFRSVKSFLGYTEDEETALEGFQQKIPYEVSVADEKFIRQAIVLTNQEVSELDECQHRVILKLKSDCNSMNDETLSKVAVMLLNCQSNVEGRRMYPCHDQMSIKDCTQHMDGDAWNSYHLMSNRVRAVCFSIRQVQFRGMTEHTINRLMDSAKKQVSTLDKIVSDQETLKGGLKAVSDGHAALSEQQRDMLKAQLYGQLSIEDNIKRLADEKAMIAESKDQLANLSEMLKGKLDDASQQMENQAEETNEKHKELLIDLIAIKEKATVIFQKIAESSELLVKQSELAQLQYTHTLNQLKEVNATITSLVALVGGTKQALEERMAWLTESVGGTDEAIERLSVILWHIAFLLIGMIACAFLSAPTLTRLCVVSVVPCNLYLSLYKYEQAVDAFILTAGIVTVAMLHYLITWVLNRKSTKNIKLGLTFLNTPVKKTYSDNSDDAESEIDRVTREDSPFMNGHIPPTPSISRNSYLSPNSLLREFSPTRTDGNGLRETTPRSARGIRERTPLSGVRNVCKANTRLGTPCKLSSLIGKEYCYRHQKGDSVMR